MSSDKDDAFNAMAKDACAVVPALLQAAMQSPSPEGAALALLMVAKQVSLAIRDKALTLEILLKIAEGSTIHLVKLSELAEAAAGFERLAGGKTN